jgi:predicted RNase H-like nuclease
MDVVGVDGARGGWVAVRLTDGRFAEALFFEKFSNLAQAYSQAIVIAVDIPIGLPDRGRCRQVDCSSVWPQRACRKSRTPFGAV